MHLLILHILKLKYSTITIQSPQSELFGTVLCFFSFKFFSTHEHFARFTITKRRIGCQFAPTDMQFVNFLVQTKLNRFKGSSSVWTIAKWLWFGHTTATPVVILRTENRVLDFVWANAGWNWEWVLSFVSFKSSSKLLTFIFTYGNIWHRSQTFV